MKWYLLTIILIAYPIMELSRLIRVYYFQIEAKPTLIWEFTLMWIGFISGLCIMARRFK